MKVSQKLQIIVVISISIILFYWKLNDTYLTNWDEAWYASIARQMSESGDFITPIYNGQKWFAASPFYLWLSAIWFKLFDFSSLGARFFSSSFSIATIFFTYLIGKKLFSHKAGLIAAVVLASCIQFLYRGRTGNLDATLTFFITFSFYSFIKSKEDIRWLYLLGISTGLAFLAKGIFGLFPFILLALIPKSLAIKALILFIIVTLPWHLVVFMRNGQPFLDHYFNQYMFSKAFVANPVSGLDVFWYVSTLRHGLKLWFPIFIIAFLYSIFSFGKNSKLKFILSWFLLPFILITVARMRNDWYIYFLYPAISLITGYFLSSLNRKLNDTILFATIFLIAIFNLLKYKHSYIIPETVAAEVNLATQAKELTETDETILLDDNYLPVATLYSNRVVIPLRYSREKSSLVSDESIREATKSSIRKIVLTNTETIQQLLERFNYSETKIIDQKDDKILMEFKF